MESVWHATNPVTVPAVEFTENAHFDTVIAGAGLTGLTAALLLARAGHRVAVVEARQVGALTTGNTTGKLSLLQGTVLSEILQRGSARVLDAYIEANHEGQAWLVRYMDDHGVPYERRDAFGYAVTDDGRARLLAEQVACEVAGLEVEWLRQTELPFAAQALRMADQVQIHPLVVLAELLWDFTSHGGVLFEDTRVSAAEGTPLKVATSRGSLLADRLILATGIPVIDKDGYFTRLTPLRSYAMTYRVPGPIPRGMYLSADQTIRTLRTVNVGSDELLLVGGNGHITGRAQSPARALSVLDEWTARYFPDAERVNTWAAQDYRAIKRVPFVGELPGTNAQIYFATGFNKWGLTNAVAAALALSTEILGGTLHWTEALSPRMVGMVAPGAESDGADGDASQSGQPPESVLSRLPDEPPEEGMGHTGLGAGGEPEAVSTVDGMTRRVSAVCTHMGGMVQWNDAECSWDCQLHGSRFAADGTLLEGPAVTDLPPSV